MPRVKCRRGDTCFYKHDDKAAAATKDTKRANSPAPKKKAKESNAAPCLIQKFACIARKQPKATSCSDESSVSMKRLRFRKVPHVIEVKAVGRQVPVKHRPREFAKVYKTAEDVPVSSKVEQHEAQVRARQLKETVKLHDSDVAPSCGFCCWNEDTCDITCKECRFVSGPKALRGSRTFSIHCHGCAKGRCQLACRFRKWLRSSPRECWGMLAPRTAVQPSIRSP